MKIKEALPKLGPVAELHEAVAVFEAEWIQQALDRNNGNRTHAARELGVSRQTVLKKIELYGLR